MVWENTCGGGIAFIILTSFCFFYYNIPIDQPSRSGATDNVVYPETVYLQCREGYGWGKTNSEGFYGSIEYHDGMNIDVLIMGSSMVEAYQVGQNQTVCSKLNDMLPDKTVYSIGRSGHFFMNCCSNLGAALEHYNPSSVVIEIGSVAYTTDELSDAVKGTVPEIAADYGGILELLAHNQFLRIVHQQLKQLGILMNKEDVPEADVFDTAEGKKQYLDTLDELFEKLASLCNEKNTNLIILYHPFTELTENGCLKFETDPRYLQAFQNGCENHGIIFVDMTDPFMKMYEEEHMLPYGFSNTQVGNGHLNPAGHELVAEELCKTINYLD